MRWRSAPSRWPSSPPDRMRPAPTPNRTSVSRPPSGLGGLDVLQRAEHEFDPIPFGGDAAWAYGRVTAAVIAAGRKPSHRAVDLMIAATAIAAELPLYTQAGPRFAGPLVPIFTNDVVRDKTSGA
jgi:hypothetical protein